jgi:hypothetical protein
MKRILSLFCLGLLAGCNVYFTPDPIPVPELNVLEVDYETNAQLTDGTFVICDNIPTMLTYWFRYEGELESWTSYLKGQELGKIDGRETFTPESQGVSPYEEDGFAGFEVTYIIQPNVAPYQNGTAEGELSPQAIDVVPVPQPTIIGASRLYLILRGPNGDVQPYVFPEIPVIINCPTGP